MLNQGTIKFPIYIVEDLYVLRKNLIELEIQEKRKLSKEEIANKLGVSTELLNLYYNYFLGDIYLEDKVNDSDDLYIKNKIADDTVIEDDVLQSNLKEDIKILYVNLSEREKTVIKMYYGLEEYENNALSIIEIGKIFNLDRQRIYQIRNSALVKMKAYARNNLKAKALKAYVR